MRLTKEELKRNLELEKTKHKNKLEEIEAERRARIDVEEKHHENEMTRQRIKAAEIRKSIERRKDNQFMTNYSRNL